ncbi:MAG: thioredoxin family protein [Methermicoccaceae archaeon]
MEELTREKLEELLLNKEEFILDFYADWCQPCKMLEKLLKSLEGRLDGLKIYRVNIEDEFGKWLAEKFEIRAVPTMIYFKDGKETDRVVGAPNRKMLLNWIEFIRNGMPVNEKELINYLENLSKKFELLSKVCKNLQTVVQGKNYTQLLTIMSKQPKEISEPVFEFLESIKYR